MDKKIIFWSPLISHVGTINAVLKSALSLSNRSGYKIYVIDVIGEFRSINKNDFKNIIFLNILKYNQTVKNIKYADKFSEKSEIIQIDLEKFPNNISENFHYVFLFNVMEHIKNFDNCLKNAFNLIKEDGKLIGSTPFLFRVHSSPHDYLRFTDQFLIEKFKEVGFSKYKVYVLIGGIFISFYSNIFTIVNKVPFSFIINIPLFFICLLLDKILSLFSKNLKNNYPIGYYFIAEK